MKKILPILVAMAAIMLTGCNQAEQSSLDLSSISQNATIYGNVVYYADALGDATEAVAISGVRVCADVDFSVYDNQNNGIKRFEATTAEDGSFSISIPTGSKSFAAILRIEPISVEKDGSVVWFDAYSKTISLRAGDNLYNHVVLTRNAELSDYTGFAIITGTVSGDFGYSSMDDGSLQSNVVPVGKDVPVQLVVDYPEGARTFQTVTDDHGAYQFTIGADADVAAHVSVLEFSSTYTYWNENTDSYISVDCHYASANNYVNANYGQTNVMNITVSRNYTSNEEDSKGQTFKVSGKVLAETEKLNRDIDGEITGFTSGTQPYTFDVEVVVYNSANQKQEIYSVAPNGNGEYSCDVFIYNDWDLDNLTIIARPKADVAVSGFRHYYRVFDLANNVWKGYNEYGSQLLDGIYYGNTQTSKSVDKKNLYFNMVMDDIIVDFKAADYTVVRGLGYDCDYNSDGVRIYRYGNTYVIY